MQEMQDLAATRQPSLMQACKAVCVLCMNKTVRPSSTKTPCEVNRGARPLGTCAAEPGYSRRWHLDPCLLKHLVRQLHWLACVRASPEIWKFACRRLRMGAAAG